MLLPALASLVLGQCPTLGTSVAVDDEDGAPAFVLEGAAWEGPYRYPRAGLGASERDRTYFYLSHRNNTVRRVGTARWTPRLPSAGRYRVETHVRYTANRSDDADHFVRDRFGRELTTSINQAAQADGPSGWLPLFEVDCNVGGCAVELRGDDGKSDEANAIRWTLLRCDAGAAPPTPVTPTPTTTGSSCSLGAGPHVLQAPARAVKDTGWTQSDAAKGVPDGRFARIDNVDPGEVLELSDFGLCEPQLPPGHVLQITRVLAEVRGKTQYMSGPYALVLALDGKGNARAALSNTTASWASVDLTADRPRWTLDDVRSVGLRVSLGRQPGGRRDSDAFIDGARVLVTVRVGTPSGLLQQPLEAQREVEVEPGSDAPNEDVDELNAQTAGCSSAVASPSLLALALLVASRRRAGR